MPDTVEKAIIRKVKGGKASETELVKCQFNPTEYTIKKTNKWTVKPKKGRDIGKSDFGGGQPATLKMKLFFDTSDGGTLMNERINKKQIYSEAINKNEDHQDVRKQTEKLWKMMMVDEENINKKTKKGEPPQVLFQWGKGHFFTAVIKSISQKFTMFLSDGVPIRAELDVVFQQYKDETIFAPQNPTSLSESRKIWVVTEGQSLDWIAYQEYGDPAQWRYIAETNDLANPQHLHAGQVLKLLPLP